ncbi:MAG: signal recognition particle subunit SRP19/SEC65 family protein [Nitrososphaerales archaeon]
MKDYKRLVLWLDYFNSSFSRSEGRRIPLDRSVKDPKLEELSEAAKRLGYSPEASQAKFPVRMMVFSGYVSIEKRKDLKKEHLIDEIAKTLSTVRGEKTAIASVQGKSFQKKH